MATGRGVPANVQPEAALRAAPGGSGQPCAERGSGKRGRGPAPEEGGVDESSGATSTGAMQKRPALVCSVGEVVVQPLRGGSRKAPRSVPQRLARSNTPPEAPHLNHNSVLFLLFRGVYLCTMVRTYGIGVAQF